MPIFAENKDITKQNTNGKDASEIISEQLTKHVSERVKLYEADMKASASPAHLRNHKSNNIRHVVPVGMIIVLFTLYLTTAAFKSNYIVKEKEIPKDASNINKRQELAALEAAKRIEILEKLLEYEDLCTELEVFTKDLRWINDACNKEDHIKEFKADSRQSPEASAVVTSDDVKEDELEKTESRSENVAVKNNNAENENYKNNISNNNIKSNSNNKKDQPIPKKTNTAEPIIYLFALVFIYLLLKAASDINQHYKLKNKGDKRLRRCSLQSYAQTHKQDRRASKGIAYNKP